METTLNVIVPYTNNGVTRDVTVLRPENQGDGLVRGFEVAYNGFFDFLPGFWKNFGARAAFTYVESSGGAQHRAESVRYESADELAPGRLSARRIEQDQLQRGALLQHRAVRGATRLQLA